MQTAPCKYGFNSDTLFLGLLLFIFLPFLLPAQDSESAVIYKAEGSDFSLSSQGERRIFSSEAAAGGLTLNPWDLIQTGPGVFLEIQLLPSGTLIKVSENTSFVFNGYDSSGRFADFGLLYGRIRLVLGTGGDRTAVVRSANISVRVEEGDLGIDYVMEPLARNRGGVPRPILRLYDFSGSAEVFPFPSGGSPVQAGEIQSIVVREGESLFLEVASPMVFAERKALDKDIIDFWRNHNFYGMPPLAMPSVTLPDVAGETAVTEIPAEVPEPVVPASVFNSQDYLALSRARIVKNAALVTGLFLTAASVTAQGLAYSKFDTEHDAFARNVFTASFAPMGVGIFTILTGIFYNPRIVSP
jgi:hypothetical protein